MGMMKMGKGIAIMLLLFLTGCNPAADPVMEEASGPSTADRVFPIEEEITYIEMLVGMQELYSARLALDNLLFTLNGEFGDELLESRVNDVLMILEDLEKLGFFDRQGPEFTGAAAVAIAMERYGGNDDFLFFYHGHPSFFGPSYEDHGHFTRSGFYVAIKSAASIRDNPEDAEILMLLFVADDGSIVEID